MSAQDFALTTILRHPMLDPLPVQAFAIRYMNLARLDLGISIHVAVPTASVDLTAIQ